MRLRKLRAAAPWGRPERSGFPLPAAAAPWPRPVASTAGKWRAAAPWLLASLVLLGGACGWLRSAGPSGVAARVNGYNITNAELAQALAQQTQGAETTIPEDQLDRLRLGLLSQLIDREVLLQYAAHLGIVPKPEDVARQMGIEKIKQPGLDESALRRRATEQLILDDLFTREIRDKIQVTDAEIDAYYSANKSLFNVTEPRYHLREILVTSKPAPVVNLAGDKAGNARQAHDKIQMLEQQLKQGVDFGTLAQEYSEDPDTASSGGDMGLISESALDTQVPVPLRQAIMLLSPGQVSPPVVTPQGTYLLQLVDKQSPGQHPVSDPKVRSAIRDALMNEREMVLRAALVATLRSRADIRNYLAERLLAQNAVASRR